MFELWQNKYEELASTFLVNFKKSSFLSRKFDIPGNFKQNTIFQAPANSQKRVFWRKLIGLFSVNSMHY